MPTRIERKLSRDVLRLQAAVAVPPPPSLTEAEVTALIAANVPEILYGIAAPPDPAGHIDGTIYIQYAP